METKGHIAFMKASGLHVTLFRHRVLEKCLVATQKSGFAPYLHNLD